MSKNYLIQLNSDLRQTLRYTIWNKRARLIKKQAKQHESLRQTTINQLNELDKILLNA